MKEKIRSIYKQRKGIHGYRRIQAELVRQYGCKVNHKKVLRLMQNLGIKAVIRRSRNDNALVLETFKKAFKTQKDVTGVIVHNDQGHQYTSRAYHDMLPTVGAQISMSRRSNCLDNSSMESFFSHLKTEALYP
ncbi:IS3 family transposase [Brevibacillus brevis]|uniref:IS3 family transposase n=1 Tax=Brevibacillus sp. AG TaxID=3020891 RepID=UPI001112FF5F